MQTICEGEGRFGQFLPGPNEAHDYEPQAYSHPGVSFSWPRRLLASSPN